MSTNADKYKNPYGTMPDDEFENDFQIGSGKGKKRTPNSTLTPKKNYSGELFYPDGYQRASKADEEPQITTEFTPNEVHTRLRKAEGKSTRNPQKIQDKAGRPKGSGKGKSPVNHSLILPKGWGKKPINIEEADEIMRNAEKQRRIAKSFEPEDNSRFLNFTLLLYRLGEVDIDDVDAVRDRIFGYFELCARYDMKPSMAELALAMRMTRLQLYYFKNNNGQKRLKREVREALRMAEAIIDAQMNAYMLNGKVNPVSGIFLMKNCFGYKDKTELEISPGAGFALEPSLDDIVAALPSDERDVIENVAYKVEESDGVKRAEGRADEANSYYEGGFEGLG